MPLMVCPILACLTQLFGWTPIFIVQANDVDTQGEEGGAAKSGRSGDDDNASANAESAEGDDNHE